MVDNDKTREAMETKCITIRSLVYCFIASSKYKFIVFYSKSLNLAGSLGALYSLVYLDKHRYILAYGNGNIKSSSQRLRG